MLRLYMMKETEKYKEKCNEEKVKQLRNIFNNCLANNNNKIENCQEYRNKLEECYNFLDEKTN